MKILYIALFLILTSCFSETGDFDYREYTYEITYNDNKVDTLIVDNAFHVTDMHKCFRNYEQIICDVKKLICIKDTIIRKEK